ncbi:MAG: hypothetical protein HOO67_05735 [Candidatus Peribacteraceae bacterium]|nr:hypothetical protein [Candidatus Peribacteraceae bacterium]
MLHTPKLAGDLYTALSTARMDAKQALGVKRLSGYLLQRYRSISTKINSAATKKLKEVEHAEKEVLKDPYESETFMYNKKIGTRTERTKLDVKIDSRTSLEILDDIQEFRDYVAETLISKN